MSESGVQPMGPSTARPRGWLTWTGLILALLLLLLITPAGWLWLQYRRVQHDEAVVAQLRASPGRLDVNPAVEFGPEWLNDLLGQDVLQKLTVLLIYAPGNSFSSEFDDQGRHYVKRTYVAGVTHDDLRAIGTLSELRRLALEAHPVDDAGVTHLSELQQLQSLSLANTQITDRALASISRLPNLLMLDISRTDVTDACLPDLLRCRKLQSLKLDRWNFSDEAIARIQSGLPHCVVER